MSKRLEVVIFEDNDRSRDLLKMSFEKDEANFYEYTTYASALFYISKHRPQSINAFVVDGNLTPGEASCEEGTELVSKIREKDPPVLIIGCSSFEPLPGADINILKDSDGDPYEAIADYIRNNAH